METIIAKPDGDFNNQLGLFCSRVDPYVILLGLDPNKVDSLKLAQIFFSFVYGYHEPIQASAESFTKYKNLARHGHNNEVLGPLPPMVTYIVPSPVVPAANIQKQFAELIQDCVKSANFSQAIGEDLGILKPVNPFDPQLGKPVIKTRMVDGGHPLLHVKKGEFQGWVLYKEGPASWVKVDKIYHPNYIDHDPLPPVGQSATWRYKAIYLYQDSIVGTESDVVSVTVFGGAA